MKYDNYTDALTAVLREPLSLKYVSSLVQRANPDIVLCAIQAAGQVIIFADKSFWSDKRIVLSAMSSWQVDHEANLALRLNLQHLTKNIAQTLYTDRDFMLKAVQIFPELLYASGRFFNDSQIVTAAFEKDNTCIEKIHSTLFSDPQFMRKVCAANGDYYRMIDVSLKNDFEVALAATAQNLDAHRMLSNELMNSVDFCLKSIHQNPYSLQYFPISMQLLEAPLRLAYELKPASLLALLTDSTLRVLFKITRLFPNARQDIDNGLKSHDYYLRIIDIFSRLPREERDVAHLWLSIFSHTSMRKKLAKTIRASFTQEQIDICFTDIPHFPSARVYAAHVELNVDPTILLPYCATDKQRHQLICNIL